MLTLILGGARSGKSRYAESLCHNAATVVYVATAARDESDQEMQRRIEHHRAARPVTWQTVEEAHDIAAALSANQAENAVFLIDCITVWLSNLMWLYRELSIEERQRIILEKTVELAAAAQIRQTILVSNEVGGGIVPENRIAREFRDLQGLVNQTLAARANRVVLIVAGLPLILKSET